MALYNYSESTTQNTALVGGSGHIGLIDFTGGSSSFMRAGMIGIAILAVIALVMHHKGEL